MDSGGRRRGKALYCLFHEDHNPSASIHRGRFHCFTCDLSLDVIDFIARVQQTDFRGALGYLADRYGVPLGDASQFSTEERARWARDRRDLDRYLRTAQFWCRTAIQLAEEILGELKAGLFDPSLPQPEMGELHALTVQIARWRNMDGTELVADYHWWRQREPGLTDAMVHAGRRRQAVEQQALRDYFGIPETL